MFLLPSLTLSSTRTFSQHIPYLISYKMPLLRSIPRALRGFHSVSQRSYSTSSTLLAPRHLLSIADLSSAELTTLVRNACAHRSMMKLDSMKLGSISKSIQGALTGKTIAMTFSKRSTRTRVSTEGAVAAFGGHAMYLGRDDIQLGVNESLFDTSVVISSMVSAIFARVGPHSDVVDLAKHSSVPVINALSDLYHPMQTIADFLTIYDVFKSHQLQQPSSFTGLGLEGLKIAWVGDANNVLYDLAIGAAKLGVQVAVATPKGYGIPSKMRDIIEQSRGDATTATLTETNVPEEAIKDADIVVTDTWISMGQEQEKVQRLEAFRGFQITSELVERGGAKPGWKFMHCLPRHSEEVNDDVFYSPRSLVFPEAENRLYAATAVLEAFVVNKGEIVEASSLSDPYKG